MLMELLKSVRGVFDLEGIDDRVGAVVEIEDCHLAPWFGESEMLMLRVTE